MEEPGPGTVDVELAVSCDAFSPREPGHCTRRVMLRGRDAYMHLRLNAGSSPFSGTIDNFKPVDTQQQQGCSSFVGSELSMMHLPLQWS